MPFTPQDLLDILNTKEGIFEKIELASDSPIIPLATLEQAFEREKKRISELSRNDVPEALNISNGKLAEIREISFDLDPLSIDGLTENLNALKQESPTLTHLAIYYGLTPAHEMILVMRGVFLDGSEGGKKLKEKQKATRSQFTTTNLTLSTASNRAALELFKSTFEFIHGKNKFVLGAYIRMKDLLKVLADLKEKEGCTHVQTTLAYLEPTPDPLTDEQVDLKCFHLIFRGVKEAGLTKSAKVYSTYDHEKGYSGPKPSCPPFGEAEE